MKCIFCKADSTSSKSVEHIIPESLGNSEHILPVGLVCDKCNNYFACKIEKPVLDSEFFTDIRFKMQIESKRNVIPSVRWFHPQSSSSIMMFRAKDDGEMSLYCEREKDSETFVHSIRGLRKGTLIRPAFFNEPEQYVFSRFLGKIALEVLTQRFLSAHINIQSLVENQELDNFRNYVRYGNSKKTSWLFLKRKLYSENTVFHDNGSEDYQVLHEYDFLFTNQQELFFILILHPVKTKRLD